MSHQHSSEHKSEDYLRAENQQATSENVQLYKAAAAGSLTGVQLALEKGAKPDFFHHPDDQKNALHVSAENGYLDIVEELLKHGANVNAVASTSQATPVIFAAQGGHIRVLQVLIDSGAHVNAANGYGTNALHAAARAGSLACVEALIAAKANINAANHKGSTALHFSVYGEDPSQSPIEITRRLLDAGCVVDAKDSRGNTPFLVCCSTGRLDAIRLLLERGADQTLRNSQGQDAHDIAVFFHHENLLPYFGHDTPSRRFA